jgi:hypothetical protein
MNKEMSTSTDLIHKLYEYFLNSYKTFVVTFLGYTLSVRERLIHRVGIYVAVRSMDGVQDYYAKD